MIPFSLLTKNILCPTTKTAELCCKSKTFTRDTFRVRKKLIMWKVKS